MPPPSTQRSDATDSQLAGAIAAGDEAAFTTFYRAWFAPTLALAKAIGRRDEAFALDVVQDVMCKVVQKLPPLRNEVAVRAWMTRAVVNAVTDRLRAETRRQRREIAAGDDQQTQGTIEPWLQLVAEERQQWLQTSIAALPSTDRELLAARFGTTTTVAAAAAVLGLSENAAHGRLRRALGKLRQQAEEWWHG